MEENVFFSGVIDAVMNREGAPGEHHVITLRLQKYGLGKRKYIQTTTTKMETRKQASY